MSVVDAGIIVTVIVAIAGSWIGFALKYPNTYRELFKSSFQWWFIAMAGVIVYALGSSRGEPVPRAEMFLNLAVISGMFLFALAWVVINDLIAKHDKKPKD